MTGSVSDLMTHDRERSDPMTNPLSVIKLGGALLANPATLSSFWPAVAAMKESSGVVIMHGGGPQATAMARRLGHEPTIFQGRRVTSDLDLSIVHWTMCGELNTQLVSQALTQGVHAVGISTISGETLSVYRRPPWEIAGKQVDFGWVGDVKRVNPTLIELLLSQGYTPIVAPLGIDENGQTYNVNADTASMSIAVAIGARSYLLVTESGGVRRDARDPESLLRTIDETAFEKGKQHGWIQGGMLVKLNVAFEALKSGIKEVYITSPDDIESLISGTKIVL